MISGTIYKRAAPFITFATLLAQTPDVPAWQTAAGGKAEFEVASVKPIKNWKPPLFDLGNGNAKAPGGRFSAAFPLWIYITFAYKLSLTGDQKRAALAGSPKWVDTDMFDVDAGAPGNPTKDQMRLMMQALLADRFKLKVRFEEREVPVYALMLATPGKTGPKLRPHSEGPPCPEPEALNPANQLPPKEAVFPATCDHDQSLGREGSTQNWDTEMRPCHCSPTLFKTTGPCSERLTGRWSTERNLRERSTS